MKTIKEIQKESGLSRGTIVNFLNDTGSISLDNLKSLLKPHERIRIDNIVNKVKDNIIYKRRGK